MTEPWIQQAVCNLLIASGHRVVLELGTYLGFTTAWLALTLQRMGGGTLFSVEIDGERVKEAHALLKELPLPDVKWQIFQSDVMTFLEGADGCAGFVWVDDDHDCYHVDREVKLLRQLMAPTGFICMHDVHGPFGVDAVALKHGGTVLRFPPMDGRIAGGLGVIGV